MSTSLRSATCVLVALMASLAGCVAGGAELADTDGVQASQQPDNEGRTDLPGHITGVVIDSELLPVPEAHIIVTPGETMVMTDMAGVFVVGPFEPGEYVVSVQKEGYATKDMQVMVTEDRAAKVRISLEAVGSDVPYHETLTQAMYLICHTVIASNTAQVTVLNAPCGAIDLFVGSTNTIDQWIFFFTIDKPGFKSLLMEMTWNTQQLGHDGLMQLSYVGKVGVNDNAGVTVDESVYGETMGPPFHDVIHAGGSYWGPDPEAIFYPTPNETAAFKMLIAGGGGNTSLDGSAFFLEFRPTAYLTFFYNRQAQPDFSILPED